LIPQTINPKRLVLILLNQNPSKWSRTLVCTLAVPKEGKTESLQHATDYAHDLEKHISLDPTNSIVERHALTTIDSSPASVYLHTNSKQYLNELLVTEEQEEIQDAVMRVFLECLYGTVGCIPWYQREREEGEIPCPKVNADAERWERITEEAENIGLEPDHVSYLVGKGSGYKTLHKAHHTYSIRVAAIHLERRMDRYTSASRAKTILTVWKYLTGYETFEDAYKNEQETRRLTQNGICEYEREDYGETDFVDWKAEMKALGARALP
jgi:hypothetical protein